MATLIACLLTGSVLFGQTPQGVLWKVSNTEGHYLYLAGSLPFSEPTDSLPSGYLKAYKTVDRIGFAFHPDSLLAEYQFLFMENGFYEADDHLEHHLDPKFFKKLEHRFSTLHKPLGHHPRMKPWLLALSFDQPEIEAAGFRIETLSDHFYRKAQMENKPLISLRPTSSFQLLMANLPEGDQLDYLKYRVRGSKKRVKDLPKIYAYWKTGKAERLAKHTHSFLKKFSPSLYETYITTKNRNWISELKEITVQEKSAFILFPVVHLVGENSIIALLEAEGFCVERL